MNQLTEQPQVQLVMEPEIEIVASNLLSEWGSCPYGQLSVVLVHLRYLALVHQTHHWQTKGDPFYGDHKLFEDLYNNVVAEIDRVAERAVGLGVIENVDCQLQIRQLMKLVASYGPTQTVPHASELAKRSMLAELKFLKVASCMAESLYESGAMTRGLDNMLAGIEDVHETHVYLLKQRCTKGP